MPIFELLNTTTDEVEEHWMSNADREEFLRTHPHYRQHFSTMNLGDPTRMGTYTNKLPKAFREGILGKAKRAHPLGTIQT